MADNTKHVKEPLIHLTRRLNVSQKYAWIIRISFGALSILVCAIISMIISPKVSFGFFFKYLFEGTFGSSLLTKALFRDMAIFLLLALAVTPCFKMRYWNIGGEGQAMMGAFGCALVISYATGKMAEGWVITLSLIAAVGFGMVWAIVPALFKAKWNTNETLLTLMFNYIAICLGAFLIKKVLPKGTGILVFDSGTLASVGADSFWTIFLTVTVITVLMFIYLYYSKHGYEITVVGESANTAKYIGINTKVVILRTLLLCGALCGIAGFLLVSVKDISFLSDNTMTSTVGGRGFTAVLISWLAHFNPLTMALTSFLVVFITRGSNNVANYARLGNSYASIMVGVFFLFIIATEFFINFKVNFRSRNTLSSTSTPEQQESTPVVEQEDVEQEEKREVEDESIIEKA